MKRKFNLMAIFLGTVLFLYSLSLLIPLFWAFMTTFKTADEFEFVRNVIGFPKEFTFSNYPQILNSFYLTPSSILGNSNPIYIEKMFLNSIIYVLGASVCAAGVPFVTAYLNTKFEGVISRVMEAIVIITMALPIVGAYPSEIQLLTSLNLYNKFSGIFLMRCGFTGVYYLVYAAAFRSLGKEYAEAACIDGASEFRIMTRIMFPLAKSTFFTVFLLTAISHWNDYQAPLLYMPFNVTISYGLYVLTSGGSDNAFTEVPLLLTGVVVVVLPILVVFLIFRNRIMNNLNIGGVKE